MDLTRPTTPVADAAAGLADEACAPFLLHHSHRTFHYGMMFVDRREVDAEAAFVASMLHDLGLTDAHRSDKGFDEVGADLACRFLEGRGWERDRIQLVEQAILLHTRLEPNEAPEHRAVQAGAALDVVGIPPEVLDTDAAREVLRSFPRLDFGTAMREAFLDEVRRQPDGSFAELERTVTLSALIPNHPLDAV